MYDGSLTTDGGGSNTINNLTINGSLDNGMYISDSDNNLIENCTITNTANSGIKIEGNAEWAKGNDIKFNTITSAKYCMWNGVNDTDWSNNTISDCTNLTAFVTNDEGTTDYSTFIGNVYSDGTATFDVYNTDESTLTATINESSSDYHKITLPNGATIKLEGDFRKDLTVTNNSYSMSSVPTINTLCNSSVITCTQNTGTYTDTLASSTFSYFLKLGTTVIYYCI